MDQHVFLFEVWLQALGLEHVEDVDLVEIELFDEDAGDINAQHFLSFEDGLLLEFLADDSVVTYRLHVFYQFALYRLAFEQLLLEHLRLDHEDTLFVLKVKVVVDLKPFESFVIGVLFKRLLQPQDSSGLLLDVPIMVLLELLAVASDAP